MPMIDPTPVSRTDPADDRVWCPACDGDEDEREACSTCDSRGWVREDDVEDDDDE